MTVLSTDATEIASIALPGPEVYHEPTEPSLPIIVMNQNLFRTRTQSVAQEITTVPRRTSCYRHDPSRRRDPTGDDRCRTFGPTVSTAKGHCEDVIAVLDTLKESLDDDCQKAIAKHT